MIPRPAFQRRRGDEPARLSDGMVIACDSACEQVGTLLRSELEAATGWRIELAPLGSQGANGTVRLEVVREPGQTSPATVRSEERYRLRAGPDGVAITGSGTAGVFYGSRSLLQLLPVAVLRRAPVRTVATLEVEAIEIEDWPRFSWRGVLLDVSRHFMPKEFLLRLVDLISFHKLNVLHLHLTDDQGWRFPVDRWPRLTEVGAWRRESSAGHASEHRFDGVPHGGFYSKDDLAELVAYAARRHVTVVPEIDLPGHVQAAIAAYPELGNSDERLEVRTAWGISEHVLNVEESTVQFCRDVLEEVMEVFPSRYVHVGGDECPIGEWEASARARMLMRELGLENAGFLQAWFTGHLAEFLDSKGRALIGWDEILELGAPKGSAIIAWQGPDRGMRALEAGHDVIVAPQQRLYLDVAYADDPREPLAIRAATSTENVYEFEPAPGALSAGQQGRLLGAQCQLWTEYVPDPAHAEYMYFPRACAFAEVVWSPAGREWSEFEPRLAAHLARLQALGVNYRPLEGPNPGQAATWSP